ncbi:hypothetical protein ACH0AE_06655 [Sphingomonas sp. 179-A 2A2 NHS]
MALSEASNPTSLTGAAPSGITLAIARVSRASSASAVPVARRCGSRASSRVGFPETVDETAPSEGTSKWWILA